MAYLSYCVCVCVCLTCSSPEYDEHVDGLMAYLSSLPDLKWVGLWAGCLTEVWANRILSLIHTCPHLEGVE